MRGSCSILKRRKQQQWKLFHRWLKRCYSQVKFAILATLKWMCKYEIGIGAWLHRYGNVYSTNETRKIFLLLLLLLLFGWKLVNVVAFDQFANHFSVVCAYADYNWCGNSLLSASILFTFVESTWRRREKKIE